MINGILTSFVYGIVMLLYAILLYVVSMSVILLRVECHSTKCCLGECLGAYNNESA
jgi:hypothetical protein